MEQVGVLHVPARRLPFLRVGSYLVSKEML